MRLIPAWFFWEAFPIWTWFLLASVLLGLNPPYLWHLIDPFIHFKTASIGLYLVLFSIFSVVVAVGSLHTIRLFAKAHPIPKQNGIACVILGIAAFLGMLSSYGLIILGPVIVIMEKGT